VAAFFLPFPLVIVGWNQRAYRADEFRVKGMIVSIRRCHTVTGAHSTPACLLKLFFSFLNFSKLGEIVIPTRLLGSWVFVDCFFWK
jgi:hypothetical protein